MPDAAVIAEHAASNPDRAERTETLTAVAGRPA
jgi:hypothetical protein